MDSEQVINVRRLTGGPGGFKPDSAESGLDWLKSSSIPVPHSE